MRRLVLCSIVCSSAVALVALLPDGSAAAPAPPAAAANPLPTHRRGPAALAGDGSALWVANAKSGTLSQVDLASLAVVAEHPVGKSLTDVVALSAGRLAVCDEQADEVVILRTGSDGVKVLRRIRTAAAPTSITLSPDGSRLFVCCLWGRRLDIVDPGAEVRVASIALSFRPRTAVVSGSRLVAADGFGSKLAVIDTAAGRVLHEVDIPGHNIRGMMISRDGTRLRFTQMILNELESNTQQAVFWGSLMANVMRDLDLPTLLEGKPDPLHRARTYFLGEVHHGSADPHTPRETPDGQIAVSLSGSNQFAIYRPGSVEVRRVPVGRRPMGMMLSADARFAFTADNLDDTVSVVDLKTDRRVKTVSLGPTPATTIELEGERLFHDARLSLDKWISCASCHIDGHTPGLNADTLGDGVIGDSKRIKSLRGVGDLKRWSWIGKFDSLDEQIRHSIVNTQQGRDPSKADVTALAAYLRTLPAHKVRLEPPAPDAAARGRALFDKLDCARCHKDAAFTDNKVHAVGTKDAFGHSKFVTPSLRGTADNGPWLHDGRAATLEKLFLKLRHPVDQGLTEAEAKDLVAYLKTL